MNINSARGIFEEAFHLHPFVSFLSFRWKVVEPEVRRVVEEGMKGIAKK